MANREPIVVEPEPTYYTAEMVRALNEAEEGSTRYECIYGALFVSPGPAPLHQIVVSRLVRLVGAYIDRWKLPYFVLTSPADVSWGRDDVLAQPDVFVVTIETARALARDTPWWEAVRHLPLAIEVVSPSSRHRDRFDKRRLYQDQRVPDYWVVDPDKQAAEAWTPELHFPRIERERLAWHPDGAAEPLVLDLAELFAEP